MRAKTAEERRVLEGLDPVAQAAGYEIVRLRLRGGAERRTLQVMAERPDGEMAVGDCAILSRAFSEVLDVEDPVSGEYILEVSSPGVDRPLTRLKDFATYEGLEARIELDRLADNRKRFKGILAGVEEANVLIDLDDEEETTLIPFAWISEAKLSLSEALLKRGAAERAERLAAEAEAETEAGDREDAGAPSDEPKTQDTSSNKEESA